MTPGALKFQAVPGESKFSNASCMLFISLSLSLLGPPAGLRCCRFLLLWLLLLYRFLWVDCALFISFYSFCFVFSFVIPVYFAQPLFFIFHLIQSVNYPVFF